MQPTDDILTHLAASLCPSPVLCDNPEMARGLLDTWMWVVRCSVSKGPHILNPTDGRTVVKLKRFETPRINSIGLISLGNES